MLLRALASPRVQVFEAQGRQCDQQVRRQSKPAAAPSHAGYSAMLNGICVAPGAYAFQWLQNGLASLSSQDSIIISEHTQQFQERNPW